MSSPASDDHVQQILGWSGCNHHARMATAIQHISEPRPHSCIVEVLTSQQSLLLSDSKQYFQVATGNRLLTQQLQHLDNRRNAGLVVSTEDSAALATKNAVLEHDFYPVGRIHRVHVRTDKKGGALPITWQPDEDVPAVAADALPCFVFFNLKPQLGEPVLDVFAYFLFPKGRGGNLRQSDELPDYTLLIDICPWQSQALSSPLHQ